jgi:hypothetical protein
MVLKGSNESSETYGKDGEAAVGMMVSTKFQKLFEDQKFERFFNVSFLLNSTPIVRYLDACLQQTVTLVLFFPSSFIWWEIYMDG